MINEATLLNEEECYLRLKEDICRGILMPNQHLVEMDLAKSYGAGRAAVRTVLARRRTSDAPASRPNFKRAERIILEVFYSVQTIPTRKIVSRGNIIIYVVDNVYSALHIRLASKKF